MPIDPETNVIERLKIAALKMAAMSPELTNALLAGTAGVLGGGLLGAGLMHSYDDSALAKARKAAYSAGVATGFGVPQVGRALYTVFAPENK